VVVARLVAGGVASAQTLPVPSRVPGEWHRVTEWADSLADSASVREVIEAAVELGKADRAADLLARHGDVLDPALRLELAGRVAASTGDWLAAAHAFHASALLGDVATSGLRFARSGDAFARADQPDSALEAYERARRQLPDIDGWLAVREAALTNDTAQADSLLALAPPAAWRRVLRIRARGQVLLGNLPAAESLLEAAELGGEAAELAIARGDTVTARRYAAQAAAGSDTADIRRAIALLGEESPPAYPKEALAAARGASALRNPRLAATFAGQAVRLGDSSAATLVEWGTWLERIGRRREAVRVYRLVGDSAAFELARARLRLGERQAAVVALRQFAERDSTDRRAPDALYLAAAATGSDRLFREVIDRWPNGGAASRARLRLAQARLDARDTAAAIPYLEDEVRRQRTVAARARYLLGRAQLAVRDREAGRATLTSLAQDDSLGYYGAVAREIVGGAAPAIAPSPMRTPSPWVETALRQLDLLKTAGFDSDAGELVTSLLARGWDDPQEMLDLAEGFVARGRGGEAIRLGYAAARRIGLNHPRVLRAVFPWPNRSLVEAEAQADGLDPYLVAGLIRQESWFSPQARSRAGAVGYMQLMPATAREVAARAHVPWADDWLVVPDANMHLGCRHLGGLLKRYRGDVPAALAAYNAGARPADRWRRRAKGVTGAGFVERISYPETQLYVRAVLRNRLLYRWLYPPEAPASQ
jgi:soluble lytic murein transglycosylase